MTDEEKESAIELTKSIAKKLGVSLSSGEVSKIALECNGEETCIKRKVQSKKIQPSIEINKEPTPPWSPPSPRM